MRRYDSRLMRYDSTAMRAELTGTNAAPGTRLPLLDGEGWWGGAVVDGTVMPFDRSTSLSRDLATNSGHLHHVGFGGNQSAPLLLSSHGRVVHSSHPFGFTFTDGELVIDAPVHVEVAETPDLRSAMRLAARTAFTPAGRTPARALFTGPVYNVWMELPFSPTQSSVLDYARSILAAGLPPGVLMIDDNWSAAYGDWSFDERRFPDPAGMVAELAELGFPVMLWIAPYITPDTAIFRWLRRQGLLLRDASGELVVREWWNGYGALLDLTNPDTVEWVHEQLDGLRDSCGIAGYKFDGGDVRDYRPGDGGDANAPVVQCQAWSRIGLRYEFNEFRASWATSGWPLMQRLADKPAIPFAHGGLDSLIPEAIAQGLLGYPFCCPDLIGGGEIESAARSGIDEEFMVRYTQCAALFPLVQFSLNPARVLGPAALDAVREAIRIRSDLLPEILELTDQAARDGEPVLRPLAYHYPGLDHVRDQFLLGPDLLVAPVLERGATSREVVLPEGTWRDDAGHEVTGPTTVTRAVDLMSLPRYRRVGDEHRTPDA